MKSQTRFILIAFALTAAVSGRAQISASMPPPSAPAWSTTFTPEVVSQYLFRGVRLGGLSFEPAVEVDSGNLAVGVWSNLPLKDKVSGQSDPEIDPYGSYKIVLNDACSLQPGFTWYTYVNADRNAGFYRSTFEPNLALNYTVGGVTISPKFYYDLVLNGPTAELDVAYAVSLPAFGTELDLSATGGSYRWSKASAIHNPETKNYGDYWLVGATLPFQVSKDLKVLLGWAYSEGRNNYLQTSGTPKSANAAAVGRGIATLGCAWTF